MTKHLPFRQIRKLADLQEQLSRDIKLQNKLHQVQWGRAQETRLTDNQKDEARRVKTRIEKLKSDLDDLVANECVYCGQIMIDSIDQPFISLDENDMVLSWMV